MKRFRVLEKADFSGEICFIPQYKKLWLWFNFYEFEMFPKLIKFHSLDCAMKFIEVQTKSPLVKIHYYEL